MPLAQVTDNRIAAEQWAKHKTTLLKHRPPTLVTAGGLPHCNSAMGGPQNCLAETSSRMIRASLNHLARNGQPVPSQP